MKKRTLLLVPVAILPLGLIVWGGLQLSKVRMISESETIPTITVKRGDVTFTVTARGELLGGNSEMLTAPMIGGQDMPITFLRAPGELVKKGDIVAQFDTTEQEFNLREAEADLSEAGQKVTQARSESAAKEEEARYSLLQAKAELRLVELEARKNPLLAAITARQNTLAVEAARDRLYQLEQDLASRKATTEAGVAIQEAARDKAKVKAEIACRNIEAMTLRAGSDGYVSIQQNTSGSWTRGPDLPMLQVGDTVRAGMPVAQIPDTHNWEVTASFGKLDRGHLAPGQKAEISVIAVPSTTYSGKVKYVGGITGPAWRRRFDCNVTLDNPSPELRPGMSAKIVVTTEVLRDVLWVPAQALFESDGRTFVYTRSSSGFLPADVNLVRRSESQVVLTGLSEGQLVAMAAPEQQEVKSGGKGPMQAIPE